jgi:hypothetical protein
MMARARDEDPLDGLDDEDDDILDPPEEVAEPDRSLRSSGTSAGGAAGDALGYEDPDDEDLDNSDPGGDWLRQERNRSTDE